MKKDLIAVICALLASSLACEPVFAIGWKEILFVLVLGVFLLGPPIYRFLRKLEKYRKQKDN